MTLETRSLEGVIQIGDHFRAQGPQALLLQLRAVAAALGHVPGERLSLGTEAAVLDTLRRQRVLGHTDSLLIDLQVLRILQQLDRVPPAARDPVVVPLEGRIAILIRVTLVHSREAEAAGTGGAGKRVRARKPGPESSRFYLLADGPCGP